MEKSSLLPSRAAITRRPVTLSPRHPVTPRPFLNTFKKLLDR
jgi:hypothetical protein